MGVWDEQEITAFDEAEADSHKLRWAPLALLPPAIKNLSEWKMSAAFKALVSLPSGHNGAAKLSSYTGAKVCAQHAAHKPSDVSPWPCHGNPIKLCIHLTHFHPVRNHSLVKGALQGNHRGLHLYLTFCKRLSNCKCTCHQNKELRDRDLLKMQTHSWYLVIW